MILLRNPTVIGSLTYYVVLLKTMVVVGAESDRCHLFTDVFGRLLQLSLAFIAIFMLYIKRKLEFSIRPIKVWALDVSKQSLGALYIHCISVILSIVMVATSSETYDEVRQAVANQGVCLTQLTRLYGWDSVGSTSSTTSLTRHGEASS